MGSSWTGGNVGVNEQIFEIIMDKNTQHLGEVNTYINCECNNEILRVTKFDDEDSYYLTVYSYHADKYSLWDRLKALFGGRIITCDVILSKENFELLKKL